MMPRLWRFRRRCVRKLRACRTEVMHEYLLAAQKIKPGYINDTPLIIADLELTGLNVSQHRIIAIGWTLIDQGRIRMGSNRHMLVQALQPVGESAIIHELTDTEVASGHAPAVVLEELFRAAAGRAWVFHHGALDVDFLRQACLDWCGVKPPFVYLDTMHMELSTRHRRGETIHRGDLQLSSLRERYHLPGYAAHNALNDALATAELLLAQTARKSSKDAVPLKKLVHYS